MATEECHGHVISTPCHEGSGEWRHQGMGSGSWESLWAPVCLFLLRAEKVEGSSAGVAGEIFTPTGLLSDFDVALSLKTLLQFNRGLRP
ncbi:hypothetical protein E2C01_072394 [Portunus trituberculatus]|uniref:Uncharacterized protein n=1 Tax=Portunus trituberculatus TaxID=210409 RepID=A0A5B7IB24_PORTR|nr:hypothetical protein [Portunus trituberculatus]